MEPYFFESNNNKLFAVYHPPRIDCQLNIGVLLCNPLHQEQIRCHKLYQTVANQLSKIGFHVLRFDFYGTGDSEGTKSQFTVTEAIRNVQSAIIEFRDGCDLEKVLLWGVRFGATICLLTSTIIDVEGMILWNPIISGKSYLTELKKNRQRWLNGSFAKNKQANRNELDIEGFIWSKELIEEMIQINVHNVDVKKSLILGNDVDVLKEKLIIMSNRGVKYFQSTHNKFWTKQDGEDENTLVPKQELEVIQNWLKDNYLC